MNETLRFIHFKPTNKLFNQSTALCKQVDVNQITALCKQVEVNQKQHYANKSTLIKLQHYVNNKDESLLIAYCTTPCFFMTTSLRSHEIYVHNLQIVSNIN